MVPELLPRAGRHRGRNPGGLEYLCWSLPSERLPRALRISKNTVRAALGFGCGCGRAADSGLAEGVSADTATVIAERIGWTRPIRTLSGRVAQLRPA